MEKKFYNGLLAKSAVLSVALTFGLASCSDKDMPGSEEPIVETEVTGVGVNAITDQSILSNRITNFKRAAASRATAPGGSIFVEKGLASMPDYAEVETAAKAAAKATYADYNTGNELVNGSGDVCITGNSTDVQIGATNKNIYVQGEITITNTWGSNYNLYILKGGKVTYNNNGGNISASQANVVVYNYGTIVGDNGKLGIYNCAKLYNAIGAKIDCKELTVNGGTTKWDSSIPPYGAQVYVEHSGLYVQGAISGFNLKAQKGCVVNVDGNYDASGIELDFDGYVRVGGELKAQSLVCENECHLYSECGILLDKDFTINSNSTTIDLVYLKAANVWQCATSSINIADGGMLDIADTYRNLNNGNLGSVILKGGSEGFAVVKAKKMYWNAGDPLANVYIFKTPVPGTKIVLDTEEYARLDNSYAPQNINGADEAYNFVGNSVEFDKKGYKIEANTGCNKAGYNTEDPGELPPVIDETSEIEVHSHDISATCVQYYNGKVYVSYHKRGSEQSGCLEVFETVDNQTTLLQYVEDKNKELDFNHLILDNYRLYTVGNHVKKGGILAWIDLAANGLMKTDAKNTSAGTAEPLTLVTLKADAKGDGNCIVRNGNCFHVMSTAGFETYDANTLKRTAFVETPGKAKHIALGNGQIYATYLTSRDLADENAECPVEMKVFSNNDLTFENAIKTVSAGTIQPNNGKNVVAVDPSTGNVYVCLGRDGLKCLNNNGEEVWTFQPEKVVTQSGKYKAFCNGVAADENYIYVAYGSFGLIILDKAGKQVAQATKDKSANYVALADGYIYVAYGQDRLHVFKFYPEGVKSYDTDYGTDE